MRNLLQLIVRHSNFLLLVGLEVVAFLLVAESTHYPHTVTWHTVNSVSGTVHELHHNIGAYFHLSTVNRQLVEENTALRQALQQSQNELLSLCEHQDPAYRFAHLRYDYIPAQVIATTYDKHHNYLTLNKGARDGITADMGVISADGVVGVVSDVSTHFAQVTPVIHENMRVSAMLKKNGYIGTIRWQAPDRHSALLEDVARHVPVAENDTLVTSGMSAIFPAQIPVGVIRHCTLKDGASYYEAQVGLATDFDNLHNVYVLSYELRQELDSL